MKKVKNPFILLFIVLCTLFLNACSTSVVQTPSREVAITQEDSLVAQL